MADRNLAANLKLPTAPKIYSQADESQTRRIIEQHWHPGTGGGDVTAYATVLLPLDNGVSALGADQFVTAPITFPYTIVGYRLIEDCGFSGSIELVVSYATADDFPTFTEISGTQRPQLLSSREQQRTTLDGWTATTGEAYSQLRATVAADATDLTRVVLAIALQRTDTATTTSSTSGSSSGGGGGGGGSTTVSVWRDGSGVPLDTMGEDGDYYLDDATGDVYTKVSGAWTVVANIKGSAGATGADGAHGSVWYNDSGVPDVGLGLDDDYYLDVDTEDVYFKSSGAWTLITNIKGDTGASGTATVWHDGTGAPSSGLGSDGDYYLDDATGDVYLKAAGAWSIVTNLAGTSGGAVPTTIAAGASYTVAADTQAPFVETIDVLGVLILDGLLIMVD